MSSSLGVLLLSVCLLKLWLVFSEKCQSGTCSINGDGFHFPYITRSELRDSYDFIVVGAGVAGSIVAARLATHESHPTVLLMDAGSKAETCRTSNQMIPVRTAVGQLTDIDWEYYTTPQQFQGGGHINNQSYWPSGKVMGGSGVLNYMMLVRGHKDDWDIVMQNKEHNVSGWQWTDVLPYFRKFETLHVPDGVDINEELHGFDGPIPVRFMQDLYPNLLAEEMIRAGVDFGLPFSEDHNDGELTNNGIAYTQFNIGANGSRVSSFIGYMRNVVLRDPDAKLDILAKAHVTKLLFTKTETDSRQIATGVEFIDLETNTKHVVGLASLRRGEVILSAGTIRSPALLLLSGMGSADQLNQMGIPVVEDIPGIGENLQDHILYFLRYKVPTAEEHIPSLAKYVYRDNAVNDEENVNEYFNTGRGLRATSGVAAQAYISSSYQKAEYGDTASFPDFQINLNQGLTGRETFSNNEPGYYRTGQYDCGDSDFPQFWNEHDLDNIMNVLAVVGFYHPKSRGFIRLASKDPLQPPEINPNYFSVNEDLLRMVEVYRTVQELMNNSRLVKVYGMQEVVCKGKHGDMNENDGNLARYIQDLSATSYHPIGTCKYGNLEQDHMAVVSETLKLKFTANVRVIDASVLPVQTSGNTQAAVMMVGEKGVSHVLLDWQGIR